MDAEAPDCKVVEAETIEAVSVPSWYILADDAPRPSAKAGTEPTCFDVGFAVDTLLYWLVAISASTANEGPPVAVDEDEDDKVVDMVVKLKYEVPALANLLIVSISSTSIRTRLSYRTSASLCRTGPAVTVLQRAASTTGTVSIIASISQRQNEVEREL